MKNTSSVARWRPPDGWRTVTTIDLHTEGEPLRVVTGGVDPIPGDSIVAKRNYARQHLDSLRRTLMFEPRGHADMYGAIITEPQTADGDLGVLFMHNEGWSTMCGHGIIGLATMLIETGLIERREAIRMDTPAGRVTAYPKMSAGRVASVAFDNVPSFAYALDQQLELPGMGAVSYDIGFGGAFYAYVDAGQLGDPPLTADGYRALIERGMAVKRAVMSARPITHPTEPDLSFLYGAIIGGKPHSATAQARNVCIFAEGEVDRSPTGTGVSGRLALEHARGNLRLGQPFTIESILGTTFTGTIISATPFANYQAIVPRVEGRAWITGQSAFVIAPDDPLRDGFILR